MVKPYQESQKGRLAISPIAIPFNEKNVNKFVLENTKSIYNGRGIIITKIKQDDVRFVSRIIATKICSISREHDMEVGLIHATYKLCIEREKVNLSKILRSQLVENLERSKKVKNSQFSFSSLIYTRILQ